MYPHLVYSVSNDRYHLVWQSGSSPDILYMCVCVCVYVWPLAAAIADKRIHARMVQPRYTALDTLTVLQPDQR